MNAAIWAAIITAIAGIIATWFKTNEHAKQVAESNKLAEHTALVEGYSALMEDVQTELKSTREELARLRQQYREDDHKWTAERETLKRKILELEEELHSLQKAVNGGRKKKTKTKPRRSG